MRRVLLSILVSCLMLFAETEIAQAIDPHAVFEERCSRCHEPHGSDFARNSLILTPDGRLVAKKAKVPVSDFLTDHFGRSSQEDIAALVDMFTRQLRTGDLFRRKCRICHTNAKKLARTKLLLRDGQLIGRFTANSMQAFLARHGRLEAGEVETIRAMLEWQLRTAAD